MLEVLADVKLPAGARVDSLRALEALKDARLDEAMELALKDAQPRLRNEGRRLLAQTKPEEALAQLARVLEGSDGAEMQGAFGVLAELKGAAAAELLVKAMVRLEKKELPLEAALDLLEAVSRRPEKGLKEQLGRYDSARPKNDDLAPYRETLVGGDADGGRELFYNKAALSCVKCHKINGAGGEVGPDLAGIGKKQRREYLLESIVAPNKQIAKGFETVVLNLTDGKTVVGVLKSEDAREVRLVTAEGKPVTVAKDKIDERLVGKSAMPDDLIKHLSRAELRDLVEFLASLK
jgi:quinoprotein glucose dehydrogenase